MEIAIYLIIKTYNIYLITLGKFRVIKGNHKSQKVPRIIAFIANINTKQITYIVTRIIA